MTLDHDGAGRRWAESDTGRSDTRREFARRPLRQAMLERLNYGTTSGRRSSSSVRRSNEAVNPLHIAIAHMSLVSSGSNQRPVVTVMAAYAAIVSTAALSA